MIEKKEKTVKVPRIRTSPVTTVAIDHTDYLGPTREDIAREKAGILRPGRVAICADRDPPAALIGVAQAIGAPLLRLGVEFGYVAQEHQGARQTVTADPSGQFQASLASGQWLIYLHDEQGAPVFQQKVEVRDNAARQVTLLKR